MSVWVRVIFRQALGPKLELNNQLRNEDYKITKFKAKFCELQALWMMTDYLYFH